MIVRFMIVLAVAVPGTAIAATDNKSLEQERPGYHITLKECIETGLQNNFSVRIMRNVEQQAANNATRGNAGQLPTLDLSASYGGSYYNNRYHYPEGTQDPASSLNNNIQAGVCHPGQLPEASGTQDQGRTGYAPDAGRFCGFCGL